jgi:UDP:flavonoid glycosyltransferase YjiC (YdhE family)
MARFLFVSLPLRGHLDWGGMLDTAASLAGRGHTVAWASGSAVQPAVERAGVAFLTLGATGWREQPPLPASIPSSDLAAVRRQRALDAWLGPGAVLSAFAELCDHLAAWRPDLVIAEPYAAAAALAAEATEVALAVCGRPALPGGRDAAVLSPVSQRVAQLCQQAGVAGHYWDLARGQIRSPLLHVDYFARAWYADLPAVAPQTRFVGGQAAHSVANSAARQSPAHPPTILITLGSLFNQDPAFFRIAAEAVFLEGGQPLVVAGRPADTPDPASLAALPAGAAVRTWVDFATTLPDLAAIIHHGGVGTTHAALCHGLPQVAVPHAGDQQPQAGRITQAQVGFGVRPADFTLANARWLARQVLWNTELRTHAQRWRAELAGLGGVKKAADVLEQATHQDSFVV